MSNNEQSPDQNDNSADLEAGRLRDAVQQIRATDPPGDSVDRAMERAIGIVSTAVEVRNQPTKTPSRRRWMRWVVGAVCCCVAAAFVSVGQSLRESARRTHVANNLKQIGLAVHNYADPAVSAMWATERYDRTPTLDGQYLGRFRLEGRSAEEPELVGGTILRYATNPAPTSFFATDPNAQAITKIIHSASLLLVVDEITEADTALRKLVEQMAGTIGNSAIAEPQGQPRTANWVVRIPVESLDEFLSDVVELGTPENRSTNSSDVTEEYVDLNARIETKRQLEKRILDLLEKNTGDIKDVLAVEEQLARVRQEIEQMEGRVKRIDTVTAMTTVNISAREERDFVPPQAPTFGNELHQTWQDSTNTVADLGKAVVIVLIAIVPWLPLIMITGFIVWRLLRLRQTDG